MVDWKQLATEAIADGYQPGNGWETMLDQHLRQYFPDLVQELSQKGTYREYLQAQTNSSLNEYLVMTDQGMEPRTAHELALKALLPTPPDEVDRPEDWEREAGMSDQMEATERFLSSPM